MEGIQGLLLRPHSTPLGQVFQVLDSCIHSGGGGCPQQCISRLIEGLKVKYEALLKGSIGASGYLSRQ